MKKIFSLCLIALSLNSFAGEFEVYTDSAEALYNALNLPASEVKVDEFTTLQVKSGQYFRCSKNVGLLEG